MFLDIIDHKFAMILKPGFLVDYIELLKALNYWNASQVYAAECVSKIKTILSIIFYSIYGAVCLQLTQFYCGDRENVYFI